MKQYTIILIHVYSNRIWNRLVFKVNDGYKLKLQTPKTMKLFRGTKKLIDKIKNGENVLPLAVVKVVLLRCNLVDNKYQQKSKMLYAFTPNKSYLLSVETSNSVYLETYNTDFDEYIICRSKW